MPEPVPPSTSPPAVSAGRRLGCGLAVVVLAAALIGGGMFLGRRDVASMTPCERYAEVAARELDNCHSGQNTSPTHLIEVCERTVSPTEACLEKIDTLTCDQLELGPAIAAGDVCRRKAP